MSGRTPKSPCGGAHCVEVRNTTGETSRKNREVSSKSTMTIPNVVKIDRYAQAVRKNFMTRSLASLVRLLRFQASASDLVPSALIANETLRNLVIMNTGAGLEADPCRLQANPSRHKRLLRLLECRLQVAALRLAFRVEHGACGAVLPLGPRLLLLTGGQRHVSRGFHDPVEVLLGDVEVHERLDRLVVLERIGTHVDEQRAREQILAGAYCLRGGLDAVDGEQLERVLVAHVVGVAEVAERVLVT